jgi:hypothetical protein
MQQRQWQLSRLCVLVFDVCIARETASTVLQKADEHLGWFAWWRLKT